MEIFTWFVNGQENSHSLYLANIRPVMSFLGHKRTQDSESQVWRRLMIRLS